MNRGQAFAISALIISGCGGGGGGGGPTPTRPTIITAMVTPPPAPTSGARAQNPTMLLGPNLTSTQPEIIQRADYNIDMLTSTPSRIKIASVNIQPVNTQSVLSSSITTGAPRPLDPTQGQTIAINNLSTATGATVINSTLSGLPATVLTDPSGTTIGFTQPYSATANPTGFIYQTFGVLLTPGPSNITEDYFSTGTPSSAANFPVSGTASYTGRAAGTMVNGATQDLSDVSATMNATADFATRSISFNTTGSTSLSINSPIGARPSANPGLNINGTLTYAAGNNTFTGPVSTANGMTGNATGRFYGPGSPIATANMAAFAPPEIGGTFALANTGPNPMSMQGAFGGSGNNPPIVSPWPTTILGSTTPLVSPPAVLSFNPLLNPNLLIPINSRVSTTGLAQGMAYTLDLTGTKVTSVGITIAGSSLSFGAGTGPTAFPLDPLMGQPADLSLCYTYSCSPWGLGDTISQSTLGGMPSAKFVGAGLLGIGAAGTIGEYILPYSAAMNPNGYTYQTFGYWTDNQTNFGRQFLTYFSAGVQSDPLTLPVSGTALYVGQAIGAMVDSSTSDMSTISATMSATADFAARTVAFSTTGTTSLSNNATPGTLPTANTGLNMTGTLSYAAGSNTFSGAVSTTNGMTGNAIGSFYGPGIAAATPTKAVGAPPEIGGTFAVMKTGAGGMAMQGAFGGK